MARSNGWDASTITRKTLASALKVRDGLAEFAQDGFAYGRIWYSPTVSAFIILTLSPHPGDLNIPGVRGVDWEQDEVAPDFGTSGIVGRSLLRMGQDGAADDEDETED
jgi:hypothetical protein